MKFEASKRAKENSNLGISNHLIGRLEGMLFETSGFKDWQEKLESLENKPAGETLKSIDLWDDLLKLDISDKYESMFYDKLSTAIKELGLQKYNFELSKIYWISFFRYLRLFKKYAGDKNG